MPPVEKPTNVEIMTGKMHRVADYVRSLHGKSFGDNHEGGLDRMAKFVVFNVNFNHFISTVKTYSDPFTPVEVLKALQQLDFLIDLFNTPDERWKRFWAGEYEYKPEDYCITRVEDGKKIKETLVDVREVTF